MTWGQPSRRQREVDRPPSRVAAPGDRDTMALRSARPAVFTRRSAGGLVAQSTPSTICQGASERMWHRLTARAIWLGFAIGADPADSVDLRVRKSLLVLISLLVLPTGLVWGALYLGVGEPLAAALPIAYTFYSIVAIAIFHVTREFAFLRRAELIAILVTPFVLGVILGGLVASSGAILWS